MKRKHRYEFAKRKKNRKKVKTGDKGAIMAIYLYCKHDLGPSIIFLLTAPKNALINVKPCHHLITILYPP